MKKDVTKKLERIAKKFKRLSYNTENYYVGGGLSDEQHVSKRHEDARNDPGKKTLGEVTRMFKTATGLSTPEVKDVINYVYPRPEWHHAGRNPRTGKMKKTYFLNADEIVDLAENWHTHLEKHLKTEAEYLEITKLRQKQAALRADFLDKNATFINRVKEEPEMFVRISQEMHGKHGWFDCTGKYYNMPIYYSGYQFTDPELYKEYLRKY